MDHNSISYVQRILDEGSISDAALSLGITQPALSSRIRKIEEEYGITIFYKDKRPASITEEGRKYLEFENRQVQLDNAFRRYISDSKGLKTGDIRIGGTNLYTQCIVPSAIQVFNRRYPGINVRVINASVPVLTSMLSKGEIDVFISSSGKSSQGIIYEPLVPTRLCLCTPMQGDERNDQDKNEPGTIPLSVISDLSILERYPFILLDESQLMGRVMREILRSHNVNPSGFIYTDQALTAYAMTKAGLGISLMYDSIVKMIYNSEDVVYYTTDDDIMLGEISVVYRDQEYIPLVVKEFLTCLKESIANNPKP